MDEIGFIVMCMIVVDDLNSGCGIVIYSFFNVEVFNSWKFVFSLFFIGFLLEICCVRVDNVNMCIGSGM